MIALLAIALRPAPAATDSASLPDAASGGPIAVTPTTRPAAAATHVPSIGPHGDAVGDPTLGPPVPRDDVVTWRDRRPARANDLQGYRWPIENARITNSYGLGRPGSFEVDGTTFHDGIDVSSFCGARIRAAHDGVVLAAGRHSEAWMGWLGDLGPFRAKLDRQNGWGGQAITVVIDDGNGYRSIYAHLGLKAVKAGDRVQAGDLIGYEGASGNATGCHLHFSIYSPLETRTISLEKKTADKTRLPGLLIARIDPLSVLPPPSEADIAWGWGSR